MSNELLAFFCGLSVVNMVITIVLVVVVHGDYVQRCDDRRRKAADTEGLLPKCRFCGEEPYDTGDGNVAHTCVMSLAKWTLVNRDEKKGG